MTLHHSCLAGHSGPGEHGLRSSRDGRPGQLTLFPEGPGQPLLTSPERLRRAQQHPAGVQADSASSAGVWSGVSSSPFTIREQVAGPLKPRRGEGLLPSGLFPSLRQPPSAPLEPLTRASGSAAGSRPPPRSRPSAGSGRTGAGEDSDQEGRREGDMEPGTCAHPARSRPRPGPQAQQCLSEGQ